MNHDEGRQGDAGTASGQGLVRGVGVWQATALNVSVIVGAGVFVTIPLILKGLPGPYAALPWLTAGLLILIDGLIWSELGAALPGSGGSYRFLLIAYGRERWGRLAAFLFIWQFMLSGPLELGSGLVALAEFLPSISQGFGDWNKGLAWTWEWLRFHDPGGEESTLGVTVNPARLIALGLGVLIVVLLYRNITA